MNESASQWPSNVPEAARNLEGFLSSGMLTGSGDGGYTQFAVFKEGSPCLDGSVIRRLGSGLVILSDIFPERPDLDKTVPPSQAEVVLFLLEAENEANRRITGLNPSARWRPGRHQTEAYIPERRRQKALEKTQRRLVSLGFSVGISLNPPKPQEDK